jgi:hypothetical protein
MEGRKDESGKTRVDRIHSRAVFNAAEILGHGAADKIVGFYEMAMRHLQLGTWEK